MTADQRAVISVMLGEMKPGVVTHGDCVGADAEFAELCAALIPRPRIEARPGRSAKGGENELCANSPHSDITHPAQTHFARNRDIVSVSDVLIAAPFESSRQDRGGTWYTVDYAERFPAVTVVIVWPNGIVD
jgi:hypothetical protein